MTVLHSQYRDSRIQTVKLNILTPMDLHLDDRYLLRDLPSIKQNGLWYPLLVYRANPTWWNTVWPKHRSAQCKHVNPIIVGDGTIWAVKMGSNRYQSAVQLGYTAIDIILCETANDCVKIGKWFSQCNPLNNKDSLPYLGLFDYEHLL